MGVESAKNMESMENMEKMGNMDMEVALRRMADLERRVRVLEERTRRPLWMREEESASREEALVAEYGEYVDKSASARILGVTRATVYAMLADGRIEGGCSGRRVSVRSIARYMVMPKGRRAKIKVLHGFLGDKERDLTSKKK